MSRWLISKIHQSKMFIKYLLVVLSMLSRSTTVTNTPPIFHCSKRNTSTFNFDKIKGTTFFVLLKKRTKKKFEESTRRIFKSTYSISCLLARRLYLSASTFAITIGSFNLASIGAASSNYKKKKKHNQATPIREMIAKQIIQRIRRRATSKRIKNWSKTQSSWEKI